MKFLNANNKKIKSDVSDIEEILEQEEILYAISENLVIYRKNNNLSQKELAQRLNVNQTMISKLESGKYNPTILKVHELSRKLENSSNIFIQILESIIKDVKRVTEKKYVADNKHERYVYSKKCKVIPMYDNIIISVKNGEEMYGEYQSEISAIG